MEKKGINAVNRAKVRFLTSIYRPIFTHVKPPDHLYAFIFFPLITKPHKLHLDRYRFQCVAHSILDIALFKFFTVQNSAKVSVISRFFENLRSLSRFHTFKSSPYDFRFVNLKHFYSVLCRKVITRPDVYTMISYRDGALSWWYVQSLFLPQIGYPSSQKSSQNL